MERHGPDHQVRHHSLDLQVQNATACSALQWTNRDASQEHGRDVQVLNTRHLHARLIEVNSQMTDKLRVLEQTVSGFKDDQCKQNSMHRFHQARNRHLGAEDVPLQTSNFVLHEQNGNKRRKLDSEQL